MVTFTLLVSVYHCMREPLHVRHINDYSHAQIVSTICGHEKDNNMQSLYMHSLLRLAPQCNAFV